MIYMAQKIVNMSQNRWGGIVYEKEFQSPIRVSHRGNARVFYSLQRRKSNGIFQQPRVSGSGVIVSGIGR